MSGRRRTIAEGGACNDCILEISCGKVAVCVCVCVCVCLCVCTCVCTCVYIN